MSAMLKRWWRRSGSARWTLLAVLTICAASALLTLALALDSDQDGMSDGYELLYGLNPADSSDATLDPDGDFLSNAEEAELSTNPWQADTDQDGWPDLIDAVPVSRAYLEFDPRFVLGDEYLCPMPPWVESVYKVGGSVWALGSRSNGVWAVYGSPKARYLEANAPALMIELNRAVLTNDLVIELVVTASAGAELRLELLDLAGRKLHHVDGNLAGGLGQKGLRQILNVPLAKNPTGRVLKFWVEKGESVELEELLLYVDQNDNRLDAEQEAQIGKSDTAPCDRSRKILLDLVENWPDLFSPVNGVLELFAAYRVRPTDGLNDDERAEEKKGYFIRQRVDVKSAAGTVVWTETRDFAIDPARIWHHEKYAPICAQTRWNGLGSNGVAAADGIYTYAICGTYLRVDPRSGKEKLIGASATLSGTVLVDSTPPVTSASVSPPANAHGWNSAEVTVRLSAQDNLAGVVATFYSLNGGAAQPETEIRLLTDGVYAVSYWSEDEAGSVEPAQELTVRLDQTKPEIGVASRTPAPNKWGWNNSPVTVTYAVSDGLSGVNTAVGGYEPDVVTREAQGQAVTGSVRDLAGNAASITVDGINLDKTAPEILAFSPSEGETIADSRKRIEVVFEDALSGINTGAVALVVDNQNVTAGATITAANILYRPSADWEEGNHTVALSLRDQADNVASGHVAFTVVYLLPDWWQIKYFGSVGQNWNADPDQDGLNNLQEFQQSTDPTSSDTDRDGFKDNADSVPVSRAVIDLGDPGFTVGDDYVYTVPAWLTRVYKEGGEWMSWYVAATDPEDTGRLYMVLDRHLITNALLRMDIWFYDHPDSSLYVDLLSTDYESVAANLYGNIMTGAGGAIETNRTFQIPLGSYPEAGIICLRRGTGTIEVNDILLYVDQDQDGLDVGQEAMVGSSDLDRDSDDDGLEDNKEVFAYGTDPAHGDTDGDGVSDGTEVLAGSDPTDPTEYAYVRYVSPTGGNAYPYTNWVMAATNIQSAIDAAGAGDAVLVTNGVYSAGGGVSPGGSLSNRIVVTKSITVQSVNGREETFILGQADPETGGLGDAAMRCAYLANGAVLSGFTLLNGFTRAGGSWTWGEEADFCGGGVYASSDALITNCTLSGNSAAWGGGAFQAMLDNCTLSGNTAMYGGGAYGATLYNCTLSGNSAGGGGGGAIASTLYGCTLTGNSASYGGGGAYNATLYNCTITGNSSDDRGGGAYLATLYNCTLGGNSATNYGGGAYWSTLTNCAISGNSADWGGGAYDATLYDCTLGGNSAMYGGGAYLATLCNCTLSGNWATAGGGSLRGTLYNCALSGNSAWAGGGAYDCTLNNCTLIGNSAGYGGGGAAWATVVNCTISGNTASGAGGGTFGGVISNSIVYYNSATNGENNFALDLEGWIPGSYSYSCTFPDPGGEGNITNEPGFADYAAGNLRLAGNSPCIDRGAANELTTDIEGNPRPVDGDYDGVTNMDMGAYEYVPVPREQNSDNDGLPDWWELRHFGNLDQGANDDPDHDGLTNGQELELSTDPLNPDTDGDGFDDGAEVAAGTSPTDPHSYPPTPIHYVSPSGGNVPPYTNWATAATNIQTAIDASEDGDKVLVTNGTYSTGGAVTPGLNLSNRIIVAKAITVQSVNGPAETIILGQPDPETGGLGDAAMRCAYLTNEAVLLGFTLANGYTRTTGDTLAERCGGGVYAENSTLINCVIRDSQAGFYGGGIHCSDAIVSVGDCSIIDNKAYRGGGAYGGTILRSRIYGNSAILGGGACGGTLNYCTIVSNSAVRGGGACDGTLNCSRISGNSAEFGGGACGGTLYSCVINGNSASNGAGAIWSSLMNCTVVDNIALNRGGGVYYGTATNCIVYYNSAADGINVFGGTYGYCCTLPLQDGMGNIADEPGFVSLEGYHYFGLGRHSPCIDTGTNQPWMTGARDIGVYPRILGLVVDMGAHEWFDTPIHYVSPFGGNVAPYETWEQAAWVIQAAINAAEDGDMVLVTNGTYSGGGSMGADMPNRIVVTKGIAVRSVNGPDVTSIVGQGPLGSGSAMRCAYLNNSSAVLAGFTLSNGCTRMPDGPASCGGGVYAANGTLGNCVVRENQAELYGGGVYGGILNGCEIIGNSAVCSGGGVAYGGTLSFCRVERNWAACDGGGAYEVASITDCDVFGNSASNRGGGVYGGAIDDCKIMYNTAYWGGGAYGSHFSASGYPFTDEVNHNKAHYGGGVANCTLVQTTISGNEAIGEGEGGGAWRCNLSNCRIIGNSANHNGGGVAYSTITDGDCGGIQGNAAVDCGGGAYCSIVDGLIQFDSMSGNTARNGGGAYGGTITHYTIVGNTATDGGGVCNGMVSDCVLGGNQAVLGGGVYGGTNIQCMISGNMATDSGGGAYGSATYGGTNSSNSAKVGGGAFGGTIVNCTLEENMAEADGGGVNGLTALNCIISSNSAASDGGGASLSTLYNSLIKGNLANNGAGAIQSSLINCTVVSNSARYSGGGTYDSRHWNSIVYYNRAAIGWDNYYINDYTSTFEYSCTTPDPGGEGNITAEPQFLNRANSNFRLGWLSPCIDAGSDQAARGATDLDGNPRIRGLYVDMGAYETNKDHISTSRHYVSPSGGNVPPYFTWATAATNIQAAIDAASDGDTVLVTNGVYSTGGGVSPGGSLSNRIVVTKVITVQSVNGREETIILGQADPDTGGLGDAAMRCAYLANGAVLSGFTLSNGYAHAGGYWWDVDSHGGGAYADGAIITNCTISGNEAGCMGGGVCGGTLYNCTISGNTARDGGGTSESTVDNCTISGNSADYGGGTSQSTLYNCTISGNTATNRGGGAMASTLYDCTLIGNSADFGGGASDAMLDNCTLSGNSAGEGGGAYWATLYNCGLCGNSATNYGGGARCWGGGASDATLYDCRLLGNSAGAGGGASDATLYNCTLSGNSAIDGGGAFYGTLYDCTLIANSADFAGGAAEAMLYNCTISDNSAWVNGGGAYHTTLNNCTITGNSATNSGGGVYWGTVNNCTINGNTAGGAGGGTFGGAISNSIVYYNSATNGENNFALDLEGYFPGTFSYSCTTPHPGGEGNITNEPGFADYAGGDYRLAFDSPCVNAGTNQSWMIGAVDIVGNPRIQHGSVDMGAYESPYQADSDEDGLPDWWEWRRFVTLDWGPNDDPDGDGIANADEYRRGTDPTDPTSANFTLQVDATAGDDANDGIHAPKRTINAAVAAAFPGDTVLVKAGTYFEDVNISGKDITVTGNGEIRVQ